MNHYDTKSPPIDESSFNNLNKVQIKTQVQVSHKAARVIVFKNEISDIIIRLNSGIQKVWEHFIKILPVPIRSTKSDFIALT